MHMYKAFSKLTVFLHNDAQAVVDGYCRCPAFKPMRGFCPWARTYHLQWDLPACDSRDEKSLLPNVNSYFAISIGGTALQWFCVLIRLLTRGDVMKIGAIAKIITSNQRKIDERGQPDIFN